MAGSGIGHEPHLDQQALEGRSGLVTGAASGIGRATVQAMVASVRNVVAADVDPLGGEETVVLSQGHSHRRRLHEATPGSATPKTPWAERMYSF